ncbi:MAG: DMT family transporter [Roseovarius sp.]
MTAPAAPHRPDNLPLAVGTIVFTVLGLSLGDAIIKLTSASFPLWQIFVLRSALALPLLLGVLALWFPAALSRPTAPGWTILRSLLLVTMWVAYYTSLPHLPLAVAAAAYYTLPLFITLFSALTTNDRIPPLGWLAVALGFAGVLLILRPDADNFNAYALLPLLAAMLYAAAMILTRTKCRDEHPMMLALALNIAFVVAGGLATFLLPQTDPGFLSAPWATMTLPDWGAMAILAASILIGSVGTAIAYQAGPSSVIGTFDFAYVGFAVLWGVIFFADLPGPITLAGMALIVAAGILSLRR